jgi:hypothetical protein
MPCDMVDCTQTSSVCVCVGVLGRRIGATTPPKGKHVLGSTSSPKKGVSLLGKRLLTTPPKKGVELSQVGSPHKKIKVDHSEASTYDGEVIVSAVCQ